MFVAAFLGCSLGLGLLAKSAFGQYALRGNLLAVPAVSAMLAAIGFDWRRKAAYASVTLAVYGLVGVLARVTGFQAAIAREVTTTAAFPSLAANLYMAFLATFPLVMLLLFVNRTPTLLWSKSR